MTLRTLLPSIGCALLLAACASEVPLPKATIDQVMAEASVANKAGQADRALVLLKGVAGSYPADKMPWQQMAQIKFDRDNYAEAISNALEALQRDPQDTVSNSIVAVSGLRLATRALADLTLQNNVSGSLRTEAQELAKLLRASTGEEVLVPPAGIAKKPGRKTAPAGQVRAKSPLRGGGSGDPFSTLK